MAATAIGLTFVMSGADSSNSDPAERYDRMTAPECAGFGVADFVQAESLEQLLSKTGTVIKGRVTDRYIDFGGPYGRRHIVYDIEVRDVLADEVVDPTVTLGINHAEVCLAPGDYEYYFFMARTPDPASGSADSNNPARFTLPWYGTQNVFPIESGLIDSDFGFGLEQYHGVTEQSFEDAVREAVSLAE